MSTRGIIGGGIVLITIVIAIIIGYSQHKTKVNADKTGMKNVLVCKNEDNDWVKIPASFYRDGAGACVEGTPPLPPAPRVRQVVQMPDCTTPCTMDITEIRDIYTDSEPVFMLPPGWSRSKAIQYSGKGHLIVEGGDIHSGRWEFWSVDPKKVVLIRVFAKR